MTMQSYIDLGVHTVPLGGQLERLEDGKKTLPKFEGGWREKYSIEFNEKDTPLGGAITGECSDIMAVDCDNEDTWNMFRALDPRNEHVLLSKGKGYSAGTLLYKFDEDLAKSFSVNDNSLALDFYSNNGFIYLATEANKTKVTLQDPLPEIPMMPQVMKVLLQQLRKQTETVVTSTDSNNKQMSALAPLLVQFQSSPKRTIQQVFKVLTPKALRDTPEYKENGFLHPRDVPAGRGSEYLSKVSAILGADRSVSETLYLDTMTTINSMFTEPMPVSRIQSTILDPMLNRAMINGKRVWQYDEDWEESKLLLSAKQGHTLELSFDPTRGLYNLVNETDEVIHSFNRETDYFARIKAIAIKPPSKADILADIPVVPVVSLPTAPFGYNIDNTTGDRLLNSFHRTKALLVLNEPHEYAEKAKKPSVTLKYLESLVPCDIMRNYLMSFLRTKLTTFKFSPVILYFMGVQGSGKDVLTSLIESIIGTVARPSTGEFLDKFNTWMLDAYFVQLDEYGNQLSYKDRDEALGKLKSYTGKQQLQVRQMRTDGFQYTHNITFIMTANKNPFMLEQGDRRIALFNTPNVLANQEWVLKHGGVAQVISDVQEELEDFCYYLATEVENLSPSQYVRPIETESKAELIFESSPAQVKIATCIANQDLEKLMELAITSGEAFLADKFEEKPSRILLSDLTEVMTGLVGSEVPMAAIRKALEAASIEMVRTTSDGRADYSVSII